MRAVLAFAFGPPGRLRLGPDDPDLDFPHASWLAIPHGAAAAVHLLGG